MKKPILFLLIAQLLVSFSLFAQKGEDQTIFITVEYGEDGGATLTWPNDPNFSDTYYIYENQAETTQDFKYIDNLSGNSWTDDNYEIGTKKEIMVTKKEGNNVIAFNVISLGKEVEMPYYQGGILLLVDDTLANELDLELIQLEQDLILEGWDVFKLFVSRNDSPAEVKELIKTVAADMKQQLKSIYIIGHVPVPYSGFFSRNGTALPPDGHVEGSGNHTGAWPADMYYGDLDGSWTDASVNYTDSKSDRNNNIPGDGKFDQSTPPSDIDVIVSRVDFYDMAAFPEQEIDLIKDYLARASEWRSGNTGFVLRGLIDDNFKNLNISASGYRAISNLIGTDSLFNDRDYLTELKDNNYYFSFGMGAGSYTSCSGIGKTTDFVENKIKTVFTGVSGSYFGDWDSKNNILRATLASGALGSFWSGIPHWYLNKLGVGGTIGDCLLYSQNADYIGSANVIALNASQNKVHTTLLGDPTLRFMQMNSAPEIVATKEAGAIKISWNEPTSPFDGFNLYRIDLDDNSATKVNNELITDNEFIDLAAPTGSFIYSFRAAKLIELPTSSYYIMGKGSLSEPISFVTSVGYEKDNDFVVAPNPTSGSFRLQLPAEITKIKSVEIRDMTGSVVFTHSGGVGAEEVINTNLATGSYILIANTRNKKLIKKLQVVR